MQSKYPLSQSKRQWCCTKCLDPLDASMDLELLFREGRALMPGLRQHHNFSIDGCHK